MPVNSVGPGGQTSGGSDVNLGRITNLDVTQFLNLLTTQMRYQDPMNPQTDMEFMTQMASLSQVQELRDLNTQISYAMQADAVAKASEQFESDVARAGELIGKDVTGVGPDGAVVHGKVTGVGSDGTCVYLNIEDSSETEGGDSTPPVVNIASLITSEGASSAETLAQCSWLLGYKVTAYLDTKHQDKTSGTVTEINLKDGIVSLKINGKEIGLGDLISIE